MNLVIPMNLVLIASPFSARSLEERDRNEKYARDALFDSLMRGEAPFVPHLLYPQVLSDEDEVHRHLGLKCIEQFMKSANPLLALYADFGISPGMIQEIHIATSIGLSIDYRYLYRAEYRNVHAISIHQSDTADRTNISRGSR